ncbi:MAG: hypothetical protein MZV65_43475 [Chromatiales bacterium]|nr:hypothetical protein [Chromatiales bacterium]
MHPDQIANLIARLGRAHLRRRLGLEADHEVFVLNRPGAHFFYPENWYSLHGFIRHALRLSGLLARAQDNATRLQVRHNRVVLPGLPAAFEGFRILHLSDLHLDMEPRNVAALCARLPALDADLCVLTGDYRAKTFGPYDRVLSAMREVRRADRGAHPGRARQSRYPGLRAGVRVDGYPLSAQRVGADRTAGRADLSRRGRRRPLLSGPQSRQGRRRHPGRRHRHPALTHP